MGAVVVLALLSTSLGGASSSDGWVETSSASAWTETSSSAADTPSFIEDDQGAQGDWDREAEKKPNFIETLQILGNAKTSDDVSLRRLFLAVNYLFDDHLVD